MKRMFHLVLFLLVFRCVLSVHWCYVCEGKLCHDSPLDNIRQDCRKLYNNNHQNYLCESRQNKTENTVAKKCILNNPSTMTECDDLNLKKQTSCYYCNRELCNTDAISVEEYLMELGSFVRNLENRTNS